MNWQKSRHIIRNLGSIIGLIVLAYLVINAVIELRQMPGPIVFHPVFFILAFSLALFAYLMQMINYHWMAASLGGNPKIRRILIGYSYSFLHKYIPGSIWGYFSRAEWYDREDSMSAALSWGASVLEIVITVSTGVAIWLAYHLSSQGLHTIFLVVVTLVPFVVYLPINIMISLLQGTKRAERFVTSLQPIPVSKWIFITANSYLQWLVFGFGLSMIFQVFSLELSLTFEDITDLVYSFARAWVSGFLTIFVPTGIGVREVVLKELLSVATQIGSAKAVLISTSFRLVTIGAELGWVLLVSLLK